MPYVTFAKQLVPQHCADGWRDGHGELERYAVVHQTLHHAQQRNVSLRYRFEEPIFFQKMLVLRMANEWKMRVKNKRERTGKHCGFRNAECGVRITGNSAISSP